MHDFPKEARRELMATISDKCLTSASSCSCFGIKAVSTFPFLKSCIINTRSSLNSRRPLQKYSVSIIINFLKPTSISRISLWYSIVVGTPGDTQKCYRLMIQCSVPLLKASFEARLAQMH